MVTGRAKGVRLRGAGPGTRPLADRVKQALFSAIEAELGDAWPTPFLDLFAGSGAAGIEALSRGAPRAVFVERDRSTARVLASNLERAALPGGNVLRADAMTVLARGGSPAGGPFGVVLLDPPYGDDPALETALGLLGDPALGWLEPWSIVAAKHFWRHDPPEVAGSLRRRRQRRFGETVLAYYRPDTGTEAQDA